MITKEYLQQELRRRIEGIKPSVETTTDNIIAEMKSILVLVDALPNYEKKYNEALERAKAYHRNELAGSRREMTEYIFPELRESEDERIRKAIITLLQEIAEDNDFCGTEHCKEYIAWLEKQKERKPAEWSEEDEKKIGRLRSVVNQLASYTDSLDVNGDYCEGDYAELDTWLKSLRPSWKPSEDEERLINTSISFLKDFADKGYENAVECVDWLKSKLNGNSGK